LKKYRAKNNQNPCDEQQHEKNIEYYKYMKKSNTSIYISMLKGFLLLAADICHLSIDF